MTTKNFVAKVSRIKNKKDKEYYIHRINIPTEATKRLGLKHGDYLFLKAKKAEWYHTLDWTTMQTTWDKLPPYIQKNIVEDGLMPKPASVQHEIEKSNEFKPPIISTKEFQEFNISSG